MNPPRTPRFDPYWLGGLVILLSVAALILLTWTNARATINARTAEAAAQAAASVTQQAQAFSEQIARHFLAFDQTLQAMGRAADLDPTRFNLEQRRADSLVLNGISRDMIMVDADGIIRQASVPEAIGQDASDRDFMVMAKERVAEGARPDTRQLFIGGASIDPIMRQWHMNVVRWLRRTDGGFNGAIAADYRLSAVTDIFRQANVGASGIVLLVGTTDGRLRARLGPTDGDPNVNITGSPMLAAVKLGDSGMWSGASAPDTVRRIHAYRRIPGRDLTVVVGLDENEAMRPATVWQRDATIQATGLTVALLIAAAALLLLLRQIRLHGQALNAERDLLAAANAQFAFARDQADAKTAQLEATLSGMTDGIAMMDAKFCLVEWNALFPELSGVPASILKIGLPMEEILLAQARAGEFGAVDPAAETARRLEILRAGRYGTTERVRPDGRIIELRRNRLPDGGFVTLYSDITERKLAENALREARALADAANEAKSRFVAIVSHEIRTPLDALLNALRLLADDDMPPSRRALVTTASQSGDALSGLINDILDMSRIEAGQLTLRPSAFALRPLLESALEMFQTQAQARGIALHLSIAAGVADEVYTDPGRLRQVILNLLSNAVKFARPGEVWVLVRRDRARAGQDGDLRITVQDPGPVIPADARAGLFRAFNRLDRPEQGSPSGTGLGLAICHHIVTAMGGVIGCDAWPGAGAVNPFQGGNAFWLTLPETVMIAPRAPEPAPRPVDTAALALPRRPLPRTRVLLVEDVPANQMVTATLLRRSGHLVDIASNGEAAIRAIDSTPYDIVFMDIYMPGMSGFEAAQRLRAMPGPGRTIPIVALTADAGRDDLASFQAAGMTDVRGKPASLPDLLSAIAQHVWPGHPANEPPTLTPPLIQPEPIEEDTMPVLAMDRVNELRSTIPGDTLMRLMESCLTDIEEMLPPFRRALDAGNLREIKAQAHTMAGMAASYGMAALETRLRAIMAAATDNDTTQFQGAYRAVAADLAAVTTALDAVFKPPAA